MMFEGKKEKRTGNMASVRSCYALREIKAEPRGAKWMIEVEETFSTEMVWFFEAYVLMHRMMGCDVFELDGTGGDFF